MAGAQALICLYLVTVGTRIVSETRRFLIDSGKEKPNSSLVIQGLLKLQAWRSDYLRINVFCNKFIQRLIIWAVLLWVARLVHDAYPEQGFSRFMVDALIGFELRVIAGNLGDCGLERAKMIRLFIDQALDALLKAKVQEVGKALLGLAGAVFGWGGTQNYQYPTNNQIPKPADPRPNPKDREGDD